MSSDRSGGTWVAGVDGCSTGWVVAYASPVRRGLRVRVVRRFEEVLTAPESPGVVVVDIPIGLPSFVGSGGRGPEKAVRGLLNKRRPSVFSVPSRRAVTFDTGKFDQATIKEVHRRVSIAARASSDPARGVSRQSLMLFSKILEVDRVIRRRRSILIFETHPELAFWRLNRCSEACFSKKTPEGVAERRKLLSAEGFNKEDLWASAPSGAKTDDLLDAVACAAVARRLILGRATPFPRRSRLDACGLPIAIWA